MLQQILKKETYEKYAELGTKLNEILTKQITYNTSIPKTINFLTADNHRCKDQKTLNTLQNFKLDPLPLTEEDKQVIESARMLFQGLAKEYKQTTDTALKDSIGSAVNTLIALTLSINKLTTVSYTDYLVWEQTSALTELKICRQVLDLEPFSGLSHPAPMVQYTKPGPAPLTHEPCTNQPPKVTSTTSHLGHG